MLSFLLNILGFSYCLKDMIKFDLNRRISVKLKLCANNFVLRKKKIKLK